MFSNKDPETEDSDEESEQDLVRSLQEITQKQQSSGPRRTARLKKVKLRRTVDSDDSESENDANDANNDATYSAMDDYAKVETLTINQRIENLETVLKALKQWLEEKKSDIGTISQPKNMNPELYKHQLDAIKRMQELRRQRCGILLADEMGLGKTVSVIAFWAYLREEQMIVKPHLVLCPDATVEMWGNEIRKHYKIPENLQDRILVMPGGKKEMV